MTFCRVSSVRTLRGHFPPYVGLQRFLIVIMFQLCRCPCRLLSGSTGVHCVRILECAYSLFRFLIPSRRAWRMCPAIFRFEDAHCGIESQPVPIWCMRFEGLRMNLVHHDVDVKVLLVIVRDNHILMVPVSECAETCATRNSVHCGRVGRSPGGHASS